MRIVKQSFEILDKLSRQDILKKIELAGRTCYKSEDKITEDSASNFIKKIVESGHHSVIEHVSISVKIITNRAILAELSRHRICSLSVESTRFISYNKDKFNNELTFIDPEYPENLVGLYDLWEGAMQGCENIYCQMKKEGAANDYARGVLPNDLKTEIVITANLREWKHIFEMRCSKAAHYQIRNIMTSIKDEFHKLLPEVF